MDLFCKIADLKSFSRAAESLSLTQPTASGHIKNLEEEFGVRLFDRLGREVTLTEAGKILYDFAQQIIALRQEAVDAMTEYAGAHRGALHIGASSIPGDYLLPRVLGQFKKAYPNVHLCLKIEDSGVISQQVLDGGVDLGVVGAKLNDNRLIYEAFAKDELVLIVPPDHPWANRKSVSVKELEGRPFLQREEGSGTRRIMEERLSPLGLKPKDLMTIAELGSNEGIREAVKAGMGISILSRLAVRSDLEAGLLNEITLEEVDLARDIYTVTHKARYQTPICKLFKVYLTQRA
jgi:DNA-binding transcriptional LysR family regulator